MELLVVAWDGAPPDLVRRLLAEGALPNLGKLTGDGDIQPLRSTVPPLTPTAWASFHLGVNPGKHGIYDFLEYVPGGKPRLYSARDFPLPTFWELLSRRVPVGVVGFPMGYPARKLFRGFWIPGFLSPTRSPGHPREALELVRHELGDFPFNPPTPGLGAEWVRKLRECIRRRTQAAILLARRYRPEALAVHFQATDSVQHFRWGTGAVAEVFASADAALGELVEGCSPKRVVLISDHGMGPVELEFHVNTWLWRHGFLRFRRTPLRALKAALFSRGFTPFRIQRLAGSLARLLDRLPQTRDLASFWRGALLGRALFPALHDVDWKRSCAYSLGGMGSIRLVDPRARGEVIAALREARDPEGRELVKGIVSAEEVYWGERLASAPDLIPSFRQGIFPSSHFLFLHAHPFSPPSLPAQHRPHGILWHNLGELPPNPSIWELPALILRHFGIEPPEYMDTACAMEAGRKAQYL